MAGPETGARILDAAAALFAAQGYAATTTREIAQRAAVNEVTLFRRFGSKAGILRALADRVGAQSAVGALSVLDADADLRAALESLARTEIDAALAHGGLALRLAFEARSQPEVAEVVGHGTTGNHDAVTAFLRDRQRSGQVRGDLDARLLADGFFALTSSLVLSRMLAADAFEPADVPDAEVGHLVSLFLDGASTPQQPPPRTRSRRTR